MNKEDMKEHLVKFKGKSVIEVIEFLKKDTEEHVDQMNELFPTMNEDDKTDLTKLFSKDELIETITTLEKAKGYILAEEVIFELSTRVDGNVDRAFELYKECGKFLDIEDLPELYNYFVINNTKKDTTSDGAVYR